METFPRAKLHTLIGNRERAEKRMNMGNSKAEKDYLKHKNEVEEFLKKHPELEKEVEKVEDHFFKILHSNFKVSCSSVWLEHLLSNRRSKVRILSGLQFTIKYFY